MKIKANKEHIKKLIEFLYHEVLMSGGDGDACWCTKYYSLKELRECFEEYNDTLEFKWEFEDISDNQFNWGKGQEGIVVTTSKELFDEMINLGWPQACIMY